MNGKDIFLGLKYIGDDLIEKAEYGKFPSKEENKVVHHHWIRRPFLIAAVVALMLLLVGCAVVYVLSMKEIKLGDQQIVQDVYEYDPNNGQAMEYIGQETKTQQVLTLAGLRGTPASQGAREWYEFLQSYDPDKEIQKAAWGKEPDFPAEYSGYGLYSQEMKDKLDEILMRYSLKPQGQRIEFQTNKLLFRALGMENVLNPNSSATMRINHASYYENGNLDLYFEIKLIDESDEKTDGYLYYRPKDCLIPDTAILTEAEWEEWNYTTTSGDPVLIIYSEETSTSWIFCDMENCTASLRLNVIQHMKEDRVNGVPVTRFERMTREQIEKVADAIDFSLEPKLIDGWQSLSDDSVPAGQEINGYRIDIVSSFTDGYGYHIVLSVTAPEGVALTDPDNHTARLAPGGGAGGYCIEDGDGKLNTCHYILSDYAYPYDYPEDGSLPYPEGYMVPVYWEDMIYSYYEFDKNERYETLLTEGTWKFEIKLNNADTREIELLSQPITAKGCTGWRMDGTDVLDDFKITSLKIRSLGIELTSEQEHADFLCFTGQFSHVVMKDGSALEFTGHQFDHPIDLDQVAYVQLADKTIIPMPGVDEATVKLISEMVAAEQETTAGPVFEDGIELLNDSITMKSLAGYVTDATGDLEAMYEYLNIPSIILHPSGIAIKGPAAFDSPESQATVILKDGREIILTGLGGDPYGDEPMSRLETDETIDLTQVAKIQLPDGTMITVPSAR